jgi:hypothetical protein
MLSTALQNAEGSLWLSSERADGIGWKVASCKTIAIQLGRVMTSPAGQNWRQAKSLRSPRCVHRMQALPRLRNPQRFPGCRLKVRSPAPASCLATGCTEIFVGDICGGDGRTRATRYWRVVIHSHGLVASVVRLSPTKRMRCRDSTQSVENWRRASSFNTICGRLLRAMRSSAAPKLTRLLHDLAPVRPFFITATKIRVHVDVY